MSDAVQESAAGAVRPSASPAGRRGMAVMVATVALAAAMIFVGDRWLRDRQGVVTALTTRDVPVWLPFNTQLTDRVDAKNTFNQLNERLAHLRQDGKVKEFVKTSYELEKFIASELAPDDARRRQVLLDVVSVAGPTPESADAYWNLLDPAWRSQLKPQYPAYAAALTGLYTKSSRGHLDGLVRLASALKRLDEPDLELQTLQLIASRSGVNMVTQGAFMRLAERLPPGDPQRAKVNAELAAFENRRVQLVASAKWYQQFETLRRKPNLEALERSLRESRSRPPSLFGDSAYAHLVPLYLRAGQFEEAEQIRLALAEREPDESDEDCFRIAEELSQQSGTNKQGKPSTLFPAPDVTMIAVQRWRGLLAEGRTADAAELASSLFDAGMPLNQVRAFAEAEIQLRAGKVDKLSPRITLEKQTADLPPEIAAAGEAFVARFNLEATTKPPGPAAKAELWLTGQHVLVIVNYADPAPTTKPSTAARETPLTTDTRLDLFFNPDRWLDYYTLVTVSDANVVYDAHYVNADALPRRRYVADATVNLSVRVTSAPAGGGWQQRILLPRDRVIPINCPAVRFNIRRVKMGGDAKNRTVAITSWTRNVTSADHRPEQFGWIILPKP